MKETNLCLIYYRTCKVKNTSNTEPTIECNGFVRGMIVFPKTMQTKLESNLL